MIDSEIQLSAREWDTLRRLGASGPRGTSRFDAAVRERLRAAGLAMITDGELAITPAGRRHIVRGSPLTWDVAA